MIVNVKELKQKFNGLFFKSDCKYINYILSQYLKILTIFVFLLMVHYMVFTT